MLGSVKNIRLCDSHDRATILAIINDAAEAYRGVIPEDCWHEPYFPESQLETEIAAGVTFYAYDIDGSIGGVMGIQNVKDVTLIRHAYVRPEHQGRGIGKKLLEHLRTLTTRPILIGTWRDATWAIRFYQANGFALVSDEQKTELLERYWNIPPRQEATSVVLSEARPEGLEPPTF